MNPVISNLVLAVAGQVNFTAFPSRLQTVLLLPSLWVAELLATLIVLMICLVPFAIFGNMIMTVIIGYVALFLCASLGWVDGWIIIVMTMLVAGLWSFATLKKVFGG